VLKQIPPDVGRPDGSRTWQSAIPPVIFLAVTVWFHGREVFHGEDYLFSDRLGVMARVFDMCRSPSPWRAFQWTENVHLGFSWAREAGGFFFHFPECLLMHILSPLRAVLVSTLLWFLLAQVFAYRFLRLFDASRLAAVIGAIMFSFSGAVTRDYVHYEALMVKTTTPLLFWLGESLARRFRWSLALVASLTMANSLLSLHPQYVCYQVPVVALYHGIRAVQLHGMRKGMLRALAFAGLIALAVPLSLPYVLPFRDQIAGSVTSGGRGTDYILDCTPNLNTAVTWDRLRRPFLLAHALFAPEAVGSDVPHATVQTLANHSWDWSVYVGVIPWFCVSGLWALKRRPEVLPLLGISALALLFFAPNLFAPVVPDFRSLYRHIPVWNMFHYIERFLFLGVFSASMLLALALDSWAGRPGRYGMLIPLLLLVALGGLAVCASLSQHVPRWLPVLPGPAHRFLDTLNACSGGNYIRHTKLGSAMSLFLVLSFALVAARAYFRLSRVGFLVLAMALLTGDLMGHGLPAKPTLETSRFLSPPPPLAQAIPQGKRFICACARSSWIWDRDISPFEARRALGANLNLFFGLSEVGGYTMPVLSKDDYALSNLMLADVPVQKGWHRPDLTDPTVFARVAPLWRLFAVEFVVTDRWAHLPGFALQARDGDYLLYRIEGSFPRASCSTLVHVVPDQDALVNWLKESPHATPSTCVILGQGFEQDRQFSEGIVTSVAGRNTRLTVEVEAGRDGAFLVLRDRWTKEWRALVDDKPTRLYKVNGIQRGVCVPAGRHTVRFEYHDRQLILGLWLAGLALLAMAGLTAWRVIVWLRTPCVAEGERVGKG